MKRTTMASIVALSVIGVGMSADDHAGANPLGFYAGASVGQSSIDETEFDAYDFSPLQFDGRPFGWGADLGIRPISFLGAEVGYVDFGTARIGPGPAYNYGAGTEQSLGASMRNRAAVLFAVGYVPLPVPWVEPFVKFGMAHLMTHYSYAGIYDNTYINGAPVGQLSIAQTENKNAVAYGGGFQFPFGSLAVRAEYERIGAKRSYGDVVNPALLAVGVTWTF